jgi:hypothetical protein
MSKASSSDDQVSGTLELRAPTVVAIMPIGAPGGPTYICEPCCGSTPCLAVVAGACIPPDTIDKRAGLM